jgi:hypothetical protein
VRRECGVVIAAEAVSVSIVIAAEAIAIVIPAKAGIQETPRDWKRSPGFEHYEVIQ